MDTPVYDVQYDIADDFLQQPEPKRATAAVSWGRRSPSIPLFGDVSDTIWGGYSVVEVPIPVNPFIIENAGNGLCESGPGERNSSTNSQNSSAPIIPNKESGAFECSSCGYIGASLNQIQSHMQDVHLNESVSQGENITSIKVDLNPTSTPNVTIMILCSECGHAFSHKDDLIEHMILKHNVTPNVHEDESDHEGGAEIEQQENILREQFVPRRRTVKRVRCTIKGCTIRFQTDGIRKLHEAYHDPTTQHYRRPTFVCWECGKSFQYWRLCSVHLWRQHSIDVDLFSCPLCDEYKTYEESKMRRHISRVHADVQQFYCSQCMKTFRSIHRLRVHEIRECGLGGKRPPDCETTDDTITSDIAPFDPYLCQICGQSFSSVKCLNVHQAVVHEKRKPFECSICGHAVAQKSLLKLHMRQHTGEKPYKCKYCNFDTSDPNSLRRHEMRHTDEKKYTCDHCSFGCIQAITFKQHMLRKHPDRKGPLACPKCDFTTVSDSKFLIHQSTCDALE